MSCARQGASVELCRRLRHPKAHKHQQTHRHTHTYSTPPSPNPWLYRESPVLSAHREERSAVNILAQSRWRTTLNRGNFRSDRAGWLYRPCWLCWLCWWCWWCWWCWLCDEEVRFVVRCVVFTGRCTSAPPLVCLLGINPVPFEMDLFTLKSSISTNS